MWESGRSADSAHAVASSAPENGPYERRWAGGSYRSCLNDPGPSAAHLAPDSYCHEVASSAVARVLRDVAESDLDAFYEHQREPEATEMALFPARDREAFDAHWQRILADDSLIKQTIVHDGQVAGNIGCWEQDGRRLIGYWVGKEFWGRGLATRALAEFVEDLPRPLHAWVAGSNVGSIRVLEKCGFVAVGSRTEHDENFGRPVEEVLYELRLAKLAIAEAGRRVGEKSIARNSVA